MKDDATTPAPKDGPDARYDCPLCGDTETLEQRRDGCWCYSCERRLPLDLNWIVRRGPDRVPVRVVFGSSFLDDADEVYRGDPDGQKALVALAKRAMGKAPMDVLEPPQGWTRDAPVPADLWGFLGAFRFPHELAPFLVERLEARARESPFLLRAGYYCSSCSSSRLVEFAPNHWRCKQCKRVAETPTWLARLHPRGGYYDPVFGDKFVRDLAFRMKAARNPDAVFAETAAHRGVPQDLWASLKERAGKLVAPDEIIVDSGRRIVFGQEGIYLETDRTNTLVFSYPLRVLRVITIEGERRVVVEDALGEFGGTPAEILARLSANAQVIKDNLAKDVLANLILRCPSQGSASYTYGVAADGDRLYLPEEYLPREGDQREALERVRPFLDVAPTREDWEKYAEFFRFFEPHERGVAPALAAIAPFAPVLRRRRVIVPLVYHYGREHGIGKTTMIEAVTRKLWNTEVEGAKTLNSDFRFPTYMDLIALPWGFDEAQGFDWERNGDNLKQSMESEFTVRRGTQKMTMTRFRARLVALMAANTLGQIPEAVLARVLVVLFNEDRAHLPDDVRKRFKAAFNALPTIGPALTRAALELCANSEARLLARLEDVRDAIEREHRDWTDNRRSAIWAVAYWGLEVWNHASGGVVAAPPIPEFCRDVVRRVEEAGRAASFDPLAKLRNYTQQYVARNRRGQDVAGTGEIFMPYHWAELGLHGWFVTSAFLDLYNRENERSPEAVIPTLKELGQIVSRKYRIPEREILPDGQAMRKQWNSHQVRVVFLPAEEPGPHGSTLPVGESGNGGNGGGPSVVALVQGLDGAERQQERARAIYDLVRAHGGEDGIAEEELLRAAVDLGVPRPTAEATVRRLAEARRIYSPTWGRYLPAG